MTAPTYLSVSELLDELSFGKATAKFILRRFDPWLAYKIDKGRRLYSSEVIMILSAIHEKLASGDLPSQIEKDLELEKQAAPHHPGTIQVATIPADSGRKIPEDIRFSPDSVDMITSLIAEIGTQQKRIAEAHEKRAAAEERKAVAIEKRAAAEEKKAEAMNNIAAALQDMNHSRNDYNTRQIAREAVLAIASDDISDDSIEEAFQESRILEHPPDDSDPDDPGALDDLNGLADLISAHSDDSDSPDTLSDRMDDGSFDDESFDIDLTDRMDRSASDEDIQDLSELISDIRPADHDLIPDHDLSDDLSAPPEPVKMDDLSMLIDDLSVNSDPVQPAPAPADMDDLSLLVDMENAGRSPSHEPAPADTMDDLSLLIDDRQDTPAGRSRPPLPADMDDLSRLIDPPDKDAPRDKDAGPADTGMDDLSLLIDQDRSGDQPEKSPEEEKIDRPSLKPDITPQDNLQEYKKVVMNIIIQLKNDGYSVEETTRRFNEDGIITLSGKDRWTEKAISQIYTFIDAAR